MDDFAIMSEADIRKEYREAKNPQLQLHILAEQNLTTVEHIRAIVDNDTRPPYAARRRRGTFRPEEIRLVERMWIDGATVDEIANKLHRSRPSLAAFLHLHRDICPSRTQTITEDMKAEICRRHCAGEKAIDISVAMAVSESTVYKAIREAKT